MNAKFVRNEVAREKNLREKPQGCADSALRYRWLAG